MPFKVVTGGNMPYETRVLSVAEDGYKSHRIAALCSPYVKITVANDSMIEFIALDPRDKTESVNITVSRADLDSLIDFFQQAKQFVEEHQIMEKLLGK